MTRRDYKRVSNREFYAILGASAIFVALGFYAYFG